MSSRLEEQKLAFLRILSGPKKGKAFKLLSSKIQIGRSSKCDLIFKEDPLCSPEHALIYKQGDSYFIQSLDLKNQVLLNKKPIQKETLKEGDIVQIGKVKLGFIQKAESKSKLASKSFSTPPLQKKRFNPVRLIFILLILGGVVLFLLEDNPSNKDLASLNTEKDILDEVKNLKKQNEEDAEKFHLNFKQKTAQAAFISGFRDYRKGYYKRAINFFKHCSTIDRKNPLCRRYELKSLSQIEKLIEKTIRVGNAYMDKKQYSACEAAFRSVQIMTEDTSSPIYKEAEMKRNSCLIKLRNRI